MNAVTTAEYVVLEQTDPTAFQHEINDHAKQGYRVVSSTSFFDDSNRAVLYNAVMVKAEPTPADLLWYQSVIRAQKAHIETLEGRLNGINHRLDGIEKDVNGSEGLQHRVGLLETDSHAHSPGIQSNKDAKSVTYVLGDLQKRVEDIEAKIDWSK